MQAITVEGKQPGPTTGDFKLASGGVGGAQIAAVSVDTETGVVKVTDFVAVQDQGLVLNPKTCESQILGAVIMGIAYALYEEKIMDPVTGRTLNPDMEFYNEHILLGTDHLLFVLALMILVRGGRRLFATVTAFTVAHSLTLGAATLGFAPVPQMPVEAAIALSIVFVPTEIVHGQQGHPGLTERKPWIVAFTFGLLHGFGFAGALAEVGLPSRAIPVALPFFNVGVEVGQLAFLAAVLAVWLPIRWLGVVWPVWAMRMPAYVIGSVAAYWTLERVSRL